MWSADAGAGQAVYARMFAADGQALGGTITVFGGGSTNGWMPGGVAGTPDGGFLVAAGGAVNAPDFLQTRLYVQKVSAAGMLVASGGTSDAAVNNGLADRLLTDSEASTIAYLGGPFFMNADGSYTISVASTSHPTPTSQQQRLLVNVDASGNVVGAPLNMNAGYSPAPVVTRMSGGNYFEAGNSTITYGPIVWQILTPTGNVVARQNLGAAPGNGAGFAHVTALADGSALLLFYFANSVTAQWGALRVDAAGNTANPQIALPTITSSAAAPLFTALPDGGYLFTWYDGSRLMAQAYSATDQAVGDAVVIASDAVPGATYSVTVTATGRHAVYEAATAGGGTQVLDVAF